MTLALREHERMIMSLFSKFFGKTHQRTESFQELMKQYELAGIARAERKLIIARAADVARDTREQFEVVMRLNEWKRKHGG